MISTQQFMHDIFEIMRYPLLQVINRYSINCNHQLLLDSYDLMIGFVIYSFLWSIVGRSWSKVDQIWSITPIVYVWHILFYEYPFGDINSYNIIEATMNATNHFDHYRVLLITILITCWGIRLTWNFARRDGYGNLIFHEEDYRWNYVRKLIPRPLHTLFNLTFISFYQNFLLWTVILPVFVVYSGPKNISISDVLITWVSLSCIFLEYFADQQQWDFQNWKYSMSVHERSKHGNKSVREGFCQYGLFRYSRHPAYFGEQLFWVSIFLFSIRASSIFNYSIIGPVLYVLLFFGSIKFSESITSSKYPAYREYQKYTSKCIPWFPLRENSKSN